MKSCVILLVPLLFLVASAHAKPNVILIMADDISAREFPIYGSSECSGTRAKTPVMDRLATQGAYLQTMWSAPLCKPSRVALMTGRYPHITKWWNNSDTGQGPKGGLYAVPESSPLTIGAVARQAGYRTFWAGKTHITNNSSALKFGFDEGVFTPGESGQGIEPNPYPRFRNIKDPKHWNNTSFYWWPELQLMNHPDHKGEPFTWVKTDISDYGPDLELKHTFDFMARTVAAEKPFFVLYTPHLGHDAIDMADPEFPSTSPGTPKVVWDPKTERYTRLDPKITPAGPVNTLGTTYKQENITERGVGKHVEYLDYQLGKLIGKLKALGQLENTVILFTSDNGTLRYGKGSVVRERGVKVPLIVYAPGEPALVKGLRNAQSDLTDLLPTVAEITGATLPPPAEYELNGKSLWPYLTGKSATHRDWIYSFSSDRQLIRNDRVLRDGDGKWWDVSKTPADLDSYPPLADGREPETRALFATVLARFDQYHTAYDAPGFAGESRKGGSAKKKRKNAE